LKLRAIEESGMEVVERVSIEVEPADASMYYMRTKKQKMGHLLERVK